MMTEKLSLAPELLPSAHLMVDATNWVRLVRSNDWTRVVEDTTICGLRMILDSCLMGCPRSIRLDDCRSSLENLGCLKVLEESRNLKCQEVVV